MRVVGSERSPSQPISDQKGTSASVIFFRELGSAGRDTGTLVLLCFALTSHLHWLIRVTYFSRSYDLGRVVRVVDICGRAILLLALAEDGPMRDGDKTGESMRLNYDCP